MPALQVRDFPDDLYARLKESAAKNHRSIAQQTIACVEAQLDQEEGRAAVLAPEFGNLAIPQNILDAVARARPVDPFDWLHDFEPESDEVIEARRKKRERLLEEMEALRGNLGGSPLSTDEIVQMIREDRDGDHGHDFLFGAEETRQELESECG